MVEQEEAGMDSSIMADEISDDLPAAAPSVSGAGVVGHGQAQQMEETRPSHASSVVDQVGKIDATLSELDRKSPAMVVCGWHTSVATDERFGQRQLWTSVGGTRAEGGSSRRPRGRHGCDGSMAAKLAWQRASEKGLFGG
jgi:hypothetical protein